MSLTQCQSPEMPMSGLSGKVRPIIACELPSLDSKRMTGRALLMTSDPLQSTAALRTGRCIYHFPFLLFFLPFLRRFRRFSLLSTRSPSLILA